MLLRLRFLLLFPFVWNSLLANSQIINDRIEVPIGGNSWVHGSREAKVTREGLENWLAPGALLDTYVWFSESTKVKLYLRASVSGSSKVRVTIGGEYRDFTLNENSATEYFVGEWFIPSTGYAKIELQGMDKSGETFGTPSAWILEGVGLQSKTAFVKDNKDNYFYWGRRGPSVHLNYPTPEGQDIEWFYNEVTVPVGQDVIGSYFMANGFGEGYFGIQVNSESERRILFSVWSPFKTDNPEAIPEAQKIKMLRKGDDVYTGEFGNEGSGGQSYLKYNWKAGTTYRFLLQGKPSGDSTTTYTAFFYAPEEGKWRLIASFKRPQTSTYLKRLHSFLENFIPTTGDVSRRVHFGNQWVRTPAGQWAELVDSRFTADATARKRYRLDYSGGVVQGQFYLQNCGFLNTTTEIGQTFQRPVSGTAPSIPWNELNK